MNVVPSAVVTADSAQMSFAGDEAGLFRILVRGSLLQLATFGFYRFWLKTDIRRHLWANTLIGDDGFEYTGRGRELLVGFLIALAVLVPAYLVYFLLSLEAERQMAFASLPLVLVLYSLLHYAFFRARRYRASRTLFRGVRLSMSGSGWAYFGRAVFWDIVTVISLGFAYPWRAAALERYLMRHTRYGDLPGAFVGTGWSLFKRVAWMWGGYLLLVVILAVALGRASLVVATILGVLVGIAGPFLLPSVRAYRLRWWLNGVRIGGVQAQSDLRLRTVLACYLRALAWGLSAAAATSVAVATTALVARNVIVGISGSAHDVSEAVRVPTAVIGLLVMGAAYLALIFAFDIVSRLFVVRGVWAAAVRSTMLVNIELLDAAVTGAVRPAGGVGEGLLDAFDFGPGF